MMTMQKILILCFSLCLTVSSSAFLMTLTILTNDSTVNRERERGREITSDNETKRERDSCYTLLQSICATIYSIIIITRAHNQFQYTAPPIKKDCPSFC